MSKALTIPWEVVKEQAALMAASGYFSDTHKKEQAVAKILYGQALGIQPAIAMQNINIIKGKPSLSPQLMGALIKDSGKYTYKVLEKTDTVCKIEYFEMIAGVDKGSLGIETFTIDDAKRAGLIREGSGWTKYPKAMLFARAMSAGARTHCCDVFMGSVYAPGEIPDEPREEINVTPKEQTDFGIRELPKDEPMFAKVEKDEEKRKTLAKEAYEAFSTLQPIEQAFIRSYYEYDDKGRKLGKVGNVKFSIPEAEYLLKMITRLKEKELPVIGILESYDLSKIESDNASEKDFKVVEDYKIILYQYQDLTDEQRETIYDNVIGQYTFVPKGKYNLHSIAILGEEIEKVTA